MTRLFLSSDGARKRENDDAHRFIGRSFGSHTVSDDVSHSEKLSEGMNTEDGVRNLWDVSDQPLYRIQQLIVEAKRRGYEVYAYRQIDDGPITRWEPKDMIAERFRKMMALSSQRS